MTEVVNLQALRAIAGTAAGDLYYAKGHTTEGDGGGGFFMWRTDPVFTGSGPYSIDNDGTIVKSNVSNDGRWIRQYEGFINVLYFGAFGVGNDYTTPFQAAIDYANLNSKINPTLKGSTVFVPNGSYIISSLLLKNGISILGESITSTILYEADSGNDGEYMFEIERGPVSINISGFNISGQDTLKGAFRFKSQPSADAPSHGGLWNSRISDIFIFGFQGHGIYFEGGSVDSNFLLPNQFNIFENVRVAKINDYKNALLMTGQQGQFTFLNCEFDGFFRDAKYSLGQNVRITNVDRYASAVISFINCTIQNADYGIYLEYAENITIDNCWFENLGVAITVASKDNKTPCKSINVLNSRFANAAGFGSLYAPGNIKKGQCINISSSFVNVYNNYVVVTDPNGDNFNPDSSFLVAYNNTIGGVLAQGNTFQVYKLGKTFGIMQIIPIISNTIDCSGNRLVFVDSAESVIKTIKSCINAGEYLTVRANKGPITFDDSDNIFLTLKSSLTIQNGEIVSFVKIDNIVGSNYETYQLATITRATT